MDSLKDKTSIVTGATRGIGRAILLELAKQGCNVAGIYKQSEAEARKIIDGNPKITMIKADVGIEDEVQTVINQVMSKYGALDIVVNNAGIDLFGKIEKYDSESWDKMVNTNLKSVFLFSKYSIPHLRKSEIAIIINISSRIGYHQYTESDFVAYGAVKAAVINFTVGLSKELKADGIRVSGIIPTPTKTDLFNEVFSREEEAELIKKGKLGQPEDVAKLVVKLIQDKDSNGKILVDHRVSI